MTRMHVEVCREQYCQGAELNGLDVTDFKRPPVLEQAAA